jgi:hypothetical protein
MRILHRLIHLFSPWFCPYCGHKWGVVAMLFFALNADAAYVCIGPSATGSGSGADWSNQKAWSSATFTRGDTNFVADGSYSGKTISTAVSGSSYVVIQKATVANHGTATGWSDTMGDGQALFTGQLNWTTSYHIFDGATGGGPANGWTNNFGFKVYNPATSAGCIAIQFPSLTAGLISNFVFRCIELEGNHAAADVGGGAANDAFAFYGKTSGITVSHVYSHDMGRCHFFVGGRDTVVEYGYFGRYKSYSNGAHAEVASIDPQLSGGSYSVSNWTFRYNVFVHIEGTGGLMFNGTGFNVYGNVFYRPSGDTWETGNGVVGGWTGASGEVFRNCLLYNNTFINVTTTVLTTLPNNFSGNEAWNNLFYGCATPSFSKFTVHDYNLFINSGGNGGEAHGSTTANSFVDYQNLNFALTAATADGFHFASPFDTDYLGSTRGGDGFWDRGAVEYGGTTPPTPTIWTSRASYDFDIVKVGNATNVTIVVSNVGTGTLTGAATVSPPFWVTNGSYSMGAGLSRTVTVAYVPTSQGLSTATVAFTGGAGASASMAGIGYTNQTGLTWQATNAAVTTPMAVTAGHVTSSVDSSADVPTSGFTIFGFNTTNGQYYFTGDVRGTNGTSDSFYVAVDSHPNSPSNIWDILPATTGFQNRTVGNRGNGTFDVPNFPTNIWTLTSGDHYILFAYREPFAAISNLTLNAYTTNSGTPPAFIKQPLNLRVLNGVEEAVFESQALGTLPLSYQWRHEGTNLSGKTFPNLTNAFPGTTELGDYVVVVTNASGSITSAVANLSFIGHPTITVNPTNQTIAPGASFTFYGAATSDLRDGALTYSWRKGGIEYAATDVPQLTINDMSIGLADIWGFGVVDTNGAATVGTPFFLYQTTTNLFSVGNLNIAGSLISGP